MIVKFTYFKSGMVSIYLMIGVIFGFIQLLWLFLLLFYFPNQNKNSLESYPGLSVIIAARNEIENLKRNIPKFKNQKYHGVWELIVVLDRCEDHSEKALIEIQNSFPQLKFIVQTEDEIPTGHSPKKSALLRAIEIASYPYILQTDADCYPQSGNWIKTMIESKEPGDKFVIGLSPYEKRKGFLNQIIQYDTALSASSMLFFAKMIKPYMSLGRNQLFDKDYFLKKGSYGSKMKLSFGDDDLLIQHLDFKKNKSLCVTKEGQMVSIPKTDWIEWFKQKIRHMMAGKYYDGKFKYLLTLNYLTLPFYVFMIASTLFFPHLLLFAIGIILVRSILFSIILYRLTHKTGSELNIFLIPLADLIHSILIPVFGIVALTRRNIAWR